MATQETTAQVAETPAKSAKPRELRSFGVRLAGATADESMQVRAHKTKAGWRTEVVHRAGKKSTRGASAEHPTIEAARAAVERLAVAAEKAGWRRREARGGGFARRPDAFGLDSLPKPGKSSKK